MSEIKGVPSGKLIGDGNLKLNSSINEVDKNPS